LSCRRGRRSGRADLRQEKGAQLAGPDFAEGSFGDGAEGLLIADGIDEYALARAGDGGPGDGGARAIGSCDGYAVRVDGECRAGFGEGFGGLGRGVVEAEDQQSDEQEQEAGEEGCLLPVDAVAVLKADDCERREDDDVDEQAGVGANQSKDEFGVEVEAEGLAHFGRGDGAGYGHSEWLLLRMREDSMRLFHRAATGGW
jgi:hypothetical protein